MRRRRKKLLPWINRAQLALLTLIGAAFMFFVLLAATLDNDSRIKGNAERIKSFKGQICRIMGQELQADDNPYWQKNCKKK